MTGGGNASKYFVSLGYDKNRYSSVRNGFQRFTLNAQNTFSPAKNLDISLGLSATYTKSENNNEGINDIISATGRKFYPYADLVDDNGNALAINYGFKEAYKRQREALGSLDWSYRPYEDLQLSDNTTDLVYNRVNAGISYKVSKHFFADAKYQLERSVSITENLMTQKMYTTRDMINRYYNPTGTIKYPVPLGSIFDQSERKLMGHTGRVQLNYDQSFHRHNIVALAGMEVKQLTTTGNQSRLYGYDETILVSQPVDYSTRFPTNPLNSASLVQYPRTVTGLMDRFRSYFGNAAYTYNDRYTLSLSGRIDQTNYFGIKSNQKAVPLWSAGLKWDAAKENFFRSEWLQQLSLRATYGFNGNVNKDLTAFTTVRYGIDGATAGTNATVVSPPNPELRWERVNMLNVGVDFALKRNILFGSLEYFTKKGNDIIGDVAMDPTTGVTSFRSNLTNIKGNGMDLTLSSAILNKAFSWKTTFLFSYATDKVLNYTRIFSAGANTTKQS